MIYPDCDMNRWECCDNQVVLANADYYYTKGQVDKKLDEIDGMTEEEVQTMINRSIRTKADKTDVNALSGQVEDNTEAIANTYTKREVDNAITAATAPVNNTLTAHTTNANIHVTSQEKTYWNNKLDASAYTPTDLSNYYTKGQTDGLLDEKLDASAYTPTDLSNYYTKNETDGVVNGAVSGKADTTAVTEEISAAVSGLAPESAVTALDSILTAHTADTGIHVSQEEKDGWNAKLDASAYTPVDLSEYWTSAQTEVAISAATSGMPSSQTIEQMQGDITDLQNNKLDASAYTPTDLSNYYTSAQTEAAIEAATSGKADTSAVTAVSDVLTAHTANTQIHVTSAEKAAWDAKLDSSALNDYWTSTQTENAISAATSGLAESSAVTAVANDVQTVSGQVQTKVATSDFNTYTAATATAINGKQDALEYYSEDTSGNTGNIHIEDAENSTQGDLFVYGDGAQMTGSRNDSDEGIDYFSSINVAPESIDLTYDKNTGDETTSAHSYLYVNENNISLEVYSNEETTTLEVNDNGVTINDDAVATEPYVDAAISGKADTSAVTTVNDALTGHTADTTVHVTSAEKAEWNGAASDASDALTALGGLTLVSLTQAEYDALATKDASTIYFING